MPGIRDHVPIDLQPLLNRLDRNFLQWMRILNNPEWRAQSFLATTDLDEAINFVQELYDAQQFLIRGQELPARFGHLPAWIIHSSWQEDRSNMYVRSMSYFSYAPYMYDAIVYSAHNPQLQMTIDNLHFYAAIRQRIVELPAIERARFDLERQAIPRRQGDLLDRDIEVEHWVVIADAADTFVLHLSMGPERRMARIVDMRDFTITDAATT